MPVVATDRPSSAAHASGHPRRARGAWSPGGPGSPCAGPCRSVGGPGPPAGVTQRVSVSSAGTAGDAFSVGAAVSADGRFVAFESEGALVPEDSEFPEDVFVHDEQP